MSHHTVRAGRSEIGSLDEGAARAGTVVLIHGWPDDPHGWDEVASGLRGAGWRVVRPWLRGWGPTRLLDAGPRASAAALAKDALARVDALRLDRAAVVGHDWGARATCIALRVAPDRIDRCAALSIGGAPVDPGAPPPPARAHRFWYQRYMASDADERAARERRRKLARYIWGLWAVACPLDKAPFARMAASFDAPDWADVVLRCCRARWDRHAPGADGAALARVVAGAPVIPVPTLVIHGAADPCTAPRSRRDGRRSSAVLASARWSGDGPLPPVGGAGGERAAARRVP